MFIRKLDGETFSPSVKWDTVFIYGKSDKRDVLIQFLMQAFTENGELLRWLD